jgi:cytochrome P450 / NADPH-cytochrome P450 reductase
LKVFGFLPIARPPAHSYFSGQPADNAARFVDWLNNVGECQMNNLHFTVFGCGNSDWTQTYQRIPKLIDARLEEFGGQRLMELGTGDASKGDFFEVFEAWEAKLWETVSEVSGSIPSHW